MGEAKPAGTYLRALRNHWVLALVVLLVTVGASVAYLVLRDDSYEATAEVLVTPLSVDQQNLLGVPLITESADSTRVAQTAAALLRSNKAATRVADELGEGRSRNEVLNELEIQPRGESNVIAVTASASGAELSAKLANSYVRAALAVQDEALQQQLSSLTASLEEEIPTASSGEREALESRLAAVKVLERTGNPTLSLTQSAVVPTGSSSPSKTLVLIAAILGGLVLGVGAALIASALDPKVRDDEELEDLLGLPVLARIPAAKRRGARARAAEAYRTLASEIEETGGSGRTVMVTEGSGGDGRTSTAAEIAAAARQTGQAVTYLDFAVPRSDIRSRNGDPGQVFGLSRSDPKLPRLDPDRPLAESVIQSPEDPFLRIGLSAPWQFQSDAVLLGRQMPRLIDEASSDGSLVVIDTPPLGEIGDGLRLLSHVDLVLVVVRLGASKRAGIESVRDLLDRVGGIEAGVVIVGA